MTKAELASATCKLYTPVLVAQKIHGNPAASLRSNMPCHTGFYPNVFAITLRTTSEAVISDLRVVGNKTGISTVPVQYRNCWRENFD